MSVWTVILLITVVVGLILYFLTAVMGVTSEKIFGRPLVVAIILLLLTGLSYYLLSEKSIYVVIKSDDTVLYKSAIKFNDKMWQHETLFVYSAESSGIDIDFSQQVKDFVAGHEEKLCRDYQSAATGTGRYTQESRLITVCVNKQGVRWYFSQ